jgi:hypothetical protein
MMTFFLKSYNSVGTAMELTIIGNKTTTGIFTIVKLIPVTNVTNYETNF